MHLVASETASSPLPMRKKQKLLFDSKNACSFTLSSSFIVCSTPFTCRFYYEVLEHLVSGTHTYKSIHIHQGKTFCLSPRAGINLPTVDKHKFINEN
jgi:hypothetical protein